MSTRSRWLSLIGTQGALAALWFCLGLVLLYLDTSSVVIRWQTASEVGTAGFNLYRAPGWESETTSSWIKINSVLIPAQGDEVVGADYRYADDGLRPGRRYQYRIEEVEWNGTAIPYDETVMVRAGLPARWIKIEGAFLIMLSVLTIWRRTRRAGGATVRPQAGARLVDEVERPSGGESR